MAETPRRKAAAKRKATTKDSGPPKDPRQIEGAPITEREDAKYDATSFLSTDESSEPTTSQLQTPRGSSKAQREREETSEEGNGKTNVGEEPAAEQEAASQGTERSTTLAGKAADGTRIPQPADSMQGKEAGNVAVGGVAAVQSESGAPPDLVAISREGETRSQCWERLRKQARLAGLPRGQGPGTAYAWATEETEKIFRKPPPPDPEPIKEPAAEPDPIAEDPEPVVEMPTAVDKAIDAGVSGLGDMPADWPQLPANAQLQVEIAWVSANRLRVRSGSGVDLSRALSPAPSYAALSWLETSILFPSKFADISVKATAQQDDEREGIRREKIAIEEIRGLLAEMLEG
jgi:hypothetical protein